MAPALFRKTLLQSIHSAIARLKRKPLRNPVAEPAFSGAPEGLRRKTYSAASGFVYQYVYRGRETASASRPYVFSATRDSSTWQDIRIVFPPSVSEAWEQRHRRTLRETERYAIVKLLLFDRFDCAGGWNELSNMEVSLGDVESKLDHLGLS